VSMCCCVTRVYTAVSRPYLLFNYHIFEPGVIYSFTYAHAPAYPRLPDSFEVMAPTMLKRSPKSSHFRSPFVAQY